MEEQKKLLEIAKLFFKLGCITFASSATHIAMLEDAVIKKKKEDDTRTVFRPRWCNQFNFGA